MNRKIFCISWGIIAALFSINVYVFQNKIRKIHAKINLCLNKFPVSLGHAEVLANNMFHVYAKKAIDTLREGVDDKSSEVLDYVLKCMEYAKFLKNTVFESVSITLPDYQLVHKQNWQKEEKSAKEKYDLCEEWRCPEVFYFHHGLRFTNKKVQNYVRNRDMIDCGAYIGDSLLVLREYTNKIVYCYEFSPPNIEKFKDVMKRNNVVSGYKLFPVALGETVRQMKYYAPEEVTSGSWLVEGGNDIVEMTTIDAEAKKHNIDVGFIKMDVEGCGMTVIKGAIETIKSQRPVLSLGIYHNNEELFYIKPFLQKNLKDYIYEFHLQQFTTGDINEMILFCYPKELAD
ncbi:MAG: FkbM family methyltransferase [Holosporaceae bacterium]|jgi:FkbM family methyltransferase|nr:FkbM family methyltransferase [Holosporaceae bacterium]